MQINILEQKEEPLLSRTKVSAIVEYEKATPSYSELTPIIASKLKKDEKLVSIRHIYTLFGKKKAKLTAYIYVDEGKKQFIEPKPIEAKATREKQEKKQ
jgi:ribosomal protein S24E